MNLTMSVNFRDIVDLQKWQDIQTHLAEVLKLNLRTIDKENTLLTSTAVHPRLCEKLMEITSGEPPECKACLEFPCNKPEKDWKEGHVCLAGLYNFFIPLKIKEETAAYLIAGPVVLGKYRKIEVYTEIAENLGMNPEEFLDMIREIKTFSFYGIRSVIEFLYDIGQYACELLSQNMRLKNTMSTLSYSRENARHFYMDELMATLLNLSYTFSGAERGSIMLLNEKNNELYIKTAKSLQEKIIEQTHLKIGEGLAGIVAREKKPLFIDKTSNDERIQSRLNNPHLTYSMLIPIKTRDKFLGILNVSTSNADPGKFTSENAKIIDMLIQLVTTE